MSTYFIHEANLERLEKKISSIRKKCNQNNTLFCYSETGVSEFREVVDSEGNRYTAKFVEVNVVGCLKHEGWRFAATIEHKSPCNVIRTFDDTISVPEKYLTCGPECEHCNRIRSRKDTYLIVNESGEFKQVGKNCLKEYTCGLDAEDVARYISLFDEMIKGECYSGSRHRSFLDVQEVLRYAFECVKHFGYEKASYDEYPAPKRTTRSRVSNYMAFLSGRYSSSLQTWVRDIQNEIDSVNFDPMSEYAVSKTAEALAWIRSEKPGSNSYINNLIGVASEDFAESRDFGLLVSLPVAYLRHIEEIAAYEKKQKEASCEKADSHYVGEIGERISFDAASFKCVSTFDTMYGTTWLYKMKDTTGNVFTWFASSPISGDDEKVCKVTGTVKKHEEYQGVKQTILNRCKVDYKVA